MSTHSLTAADGLVVKRFLSYARDEPAREWRALTLLADHAPDLAPHPVSRTTDPPSVTMTLLPGHPLTPPPADPPRAGELVDVAGGPRSGGPAAGVRLEAVGEAVGRLHSAVPAAVVGELPLSLAHPAVRLAGLRPASAVARRWLASEEAARLAASEGVRPVLGREDHNLPNFLDDGTAVRLVDFEDSGRSDRALELASLVEHLSWHRVPGALDLAADLDPAERRRFLSARRYHAIAWLTLLEPGTPATPATRPAPTPPS